jgi:hypothetical protein
MEYFVEMSVGRIRGRAAAGEEIDGYDATTSSTDLVV